MNKVIEEILSVLDQLSRNPIPGALLILALAVLVAFIVIGLLILKWRP
jgi:hypothetical protein